MMRRLFVTFGKTSGIAFLLLVFLFAGSTLESSLGYVGIIFEQVETYFWDPNIQLTCFLCLGVYFAVFILLRFKLGKVHGIGRTSHSDSFTIWLVCTIFIDALLYYSEYSPSTQALTLLGGAVLGQCMAIWARFEIKNQKPDAQNDMRSVVTVLLLILLVSAAVLNVDSGRYFDYRHHIRWSGSWDNPNTYGLLMGVGCMLAMGRLANHLIPPRPAKQPTFKALAWLYLTFGLLLVSAMMLGVGLLKSYSRGAWVAVVIGFLYLGFQSVNECANEKTRDICRVQSRMFAFGVLLCVVGVLIFWQFWQKDGAVAKRAFSVGNPNDFSWRNRVAAWEGALQMMGERPWFGFGWNQAEPMFQHYYSQSKVVDGTAIEMNDYFMMGGTLGVPALFCFGMYIWRSVGGNAEYGVRNLPKEELGTKGYQDRFLQSNWLKTTCHAGVIVLLVGFWFDGGLFKLATAAPFWILLELGAA